jgi:predicted ATPase/class 3 adenylate cyclase
MAGSPTGTVTFLFTDIEGSTKMWERDAATMQAALARHDEILQRAIEANGGYVFKTVGDAFCAAFVSTTDALDAALQGQRTLLAEGWDEGCVIRARMALHSGEAEERAGDYFGPTLNRVARLLSTGYGGQILVSRAARELAGDRLPPGTSLEDLGEKRLKDLTRPERIFQVLAPELPKDFPALKTLDARRNNLPAQPSALVGREREISEVCGRMREPGIRLLTLTGPGGTGKTRLGLQAAADLLDEHRDGVFFVALADINDTALVPTAMAGPLGVVESAELPLEDVLKEYLGRRELLLVLDNFEQVLDAVPLVGKLLSACPKLKVLATSRATLRLNGEQEYPVPPLTLPDPGRLPPVEMLERYEAVRLFAERARAVKPGFVLDGDAPAVAEICARLDGLPLAIELAAARTRLLPPKAMLKRLGDRLKFLTGGARDLPGRQQTLRGAIDWSHDLLDEEDRHLFRRMSVFSGGRTLEAMEAICDAEGDLDVLAAVESLLEKSLLRQEEGSEDEPRFVMLETIHEYAREKLEDSGEAVQTRRLHAEYFLALAEEAEPEFVGPDQIAWMDRIEAEHDNMRAALSWCMERREEWALRLAGALEVFWIARCHFSEGRRWSEEALTKVEEVSPARAKVLQGSGFMAYREGDYEKARQSLEQSLALCRQSGDMKGEARSLCFLGEMATDLHDLKRASGLLAQSASISRRLGDEPDLAYTMNNLGALALYRGDLVEANTTLEEAMVLARDAGHVMTLALCKNNLGVCAMVDRDYETAQALMEEVKELLWAVKDRSSYAILLHNLGLLALLRRDLDRAADLCAQSIGKAVDLLDRLGVACDLDVLAAVAGEQGDIPRAVRLWGAAEALRDAIGAAQPGDEAALLGPFVEAAKIRLEETAWDVAWAEGVAMDQDEAVAYALREESSA